MTKIENTAKGKYWDEGVTLVSGCSPVSEGCKHCWSARFAHRFRNNPFYTGLTDNKGRWNGHVRFNGLLLKRFERKTPTTFSIWNDLFNENVSFEEIGTAFNVMLKNPQHIYIILTKRIGSIAPFGLPTDLPSNIWLGVSVENQKTADERIPILLQIPAAVRFVSCEPLLEAIDFSSFLPYGETRQFGTISQIIAGIETGPGARPAHPNWFRKVRDQCIAAGVPYFLKKAPDGTRLLDGEEWSQYPAVK